MNESEAIARLVALCDEHTGEDGHDYLIDPEDVRAVLAEVQPTPPHSIDLTSEELMSAAVIVRDRADQVANATRDAEESDLLYSLAEGLRQAALVRPVDGVSLERVRAELEASLSKSGPKWALWIDGVIERLGAGQ